ncbi:hypothetical protein CLV44_11348 [Marinobacterium halophilum]|uniref:Uncharacterized protein n=1 Tax=Marinobacterium halophilum TaxID=267374 RepID=A0A2P8EUR7_9GAMM|nr:hypothetical protein [Marinobacterium halophilum]PSL13219.1 hypothetical protein CLV44_11348 [Marinobacterium halophilum]
MFIKIKKNSGIQMEHNGLEQRHLVPVTSNFLLNLNHIAEISFYSIKERKTRFDLEGHELDLPAQTHVIHLQMSYLYATYKDNINGNKGRLVERQYYKLYFAPENVDTYQELRSLIEEQVGNL